MVIIKKKRKLAGNRLFNFLIIASIFLAWMSVKSFKENDIPWAAGCAITSLAFIIFAALFTPYCYSFDGEGVSLCYVFLPTERYLWEDIHDITVENKRLGHKTSTVDLFFASVFHIESKNVGKRRFYMEGNIRKSLRTKYLLEKYWDGTITGYAFEDLKKWLRKRKEKKQSHIKAHFTDEIVPMEREIRAEAREWIKPFVSRAKLYDLDIKTKYCYVTKHYEELNSRPDEGYTYTLIAEIARFNETDEDRILVVSADLLYVRLGKTSYRGIKNNDAKEEFESTVSEVLDEVSKNGFESIFDDN